MEVTLPDLFPPSVSHYVLPLLHGCFIIQAAVWDTSSLQRGDSYPSSLSIPHRPLNRGVCGNPSTAFWLGAWAEVLSVV